MQGSGDPLPAVLYGAIIGQYLGRNKAVSGQESRG